jgi:hypothetical protein
LVNTAQLFSEPGANLRIVNANIRVNDDGNSTGHCLLVLAWMLRVANRFRATLPQLPVPNPARLMATTTSIVGDITIRSDKDRGYAEVSAMIGGHKLSLETGRIATIASGAVFARYGNTTVLVTAVSEPADAPPEDGGTPLQVDYMEKTFATGHIPTTYTRRETSYV